MHVGWGETLESLRDTSHTQVFFMLSESRVPSQVHAWITLSYLCFIKINNYSEFKIIYILARLSDSAPVLLLLLLSSYFDRIPTSPKCFSVGSCSFKLLYNIVTSRYYVRI